MRVESALDDPETALPFGKYELLERINIGGMAEILKARDLGQSGSPIVAVKRILPHLIDDRQFVTMFKDESRVLAQLTHANIIRTLAVGEVEETPFIALEYIFGPDARNVFHRSRRNEQPIPLAIGCYIIAEVCAGLDHAHEQTDGEGNLLGVVHRDVSLQNVLLSYEGDVKLTDFGIAMSAKNVARTEVGVVKGKFGYMSPEQIRGEPMDRRSDVFATGICLYELLTSERLFSGDSDYAAVERVRNVVIEPPSRWNRMIPSSLEAIVMKALAKHQRDRFQSAAELRRALLSFMSESGNECSARVLSQYLRAEFAEDLAKQPTPESLRSQKAMRRDEPTGLAAFDNLKPVTSVSSPFALEAVAVNPLLDELPVPDFGASPISAIVQRDDAWPGPHGSASGAGVVRSNGAPHTWDDAAVRAARAAGYELDGLDADDDVTRQMPIAQSSHVGVAGAINAGAPAQVPEQTPSLAGAPSPFVMPQPGMSAPPSGPTQRIAPWTPPAHLEAGATYGRVIGIVAAIVALIAGMLFVTRGTRTARVHFSTVPTDAQVWVDAKRWPASMSPFVIDELEPDVPHRLEVRKDGYQSWSAPLTLASGQILRLPLVTLAPARPAAAPAVAAALALAPAQASAPAQPVPVRAAAQPSPADQLNQGEAEEPAPEPTSEPAAA
ncbi:MAG TPA: serine/threonine-protein kinase, partial [Polyangiales bacterium]|nr:serine/threonine-protein kinase [Polyangiales bacterium]